MEEPLESRLPNRILEIPAPVDRAAMGDRNAQAMPSGHGLSQPGHVVTGRGDHRLRGVAAVPDAHAAPGIAHAGEHSVRADVVMRAEQPAVSPRNRRKGPLEGRDRFGKPQPMKGDPVVFSCICESPRRIIVPSSRFFAAPCPPRIAR